MIISRIKSIPIHKRQLSIALKVLIISLMIWVLYVQIFEKNNLAELMDQFYASLNQKSSWVLLTIVLLLVPVNWYLESKKWKTLINYFQDFSIKQAIYSVLSGVSLAIMTPGRIGEYGGRLVGISTENQPKAILANFISSISQNIINVGVGLLGALLFMQRFMPVHQTIFLSLIFISTGIITVLLLIYFRIDLLNNVLAYLPEWKWTQKIKLSVSTFKDMDNKSLFSILGISFLRYSTYLTQYVLLILFFGITEDVFTALLGVVTIFFFQSNLPLPPALSVLARGEMAIFLWSVFTTNIIGIFAASFLLWIINLVVPAILGTMIISQAKLFED